MQNWEQNLAQKVHLKMRIYSHLVFLLLLIYMLALQSTLKLNKPL